MRFYADNQVDVYISDSQDGKTLTPLLTDINWAGAFGSYTLKKEVSRYYLLARGRDWGMPAGIYATSRLNNNGFTFEYTGNQTNITSTSSWVVSPTGWGNYGTPINTWSGVNLAVGQDGIWDSSCSSIVYFMTPIVRTDLYGKTGTTTTASNISLEL